MLAAAWLCGLVGCHVDEVLRAGGPAPSAEQARSAELAIAQAAENLRAIETLESTGVCRIWVERDGRIDEEQLDLLLVYARPDRIAMRLKVSVSDTLAWLGSDGTHWWLFLPAESPSVAYRGAVASEVQQEFATDAAPLPPSLRSPRLFRMLLGLEPPRLPMPPPTWDAERKAWSSAEPLDPEPSNSAGLVRRWYDARGDLLSVRVEAPDGVGIAESTLSEPTSIECAGRPLGAWPRMATRLRLSRGEPREDQAGEVMLTLERPTARGSRAKPALFEWERLVQSMRPEQIVEVSP